ncbi:DNA-binding protein [candidate division MSBL1 archaeon SCGC-AAA385D11]|uniref:Sugar fermentation stimulation protein homolog n=1 Tax=candidate division MSBL1 archaeon SCGC-AAA385D11 TaxID=1698286 RepID=A0A133VNJ7_9EURY|nr:DNA-binding protein [candidate division MSBL1 archaeon SCGC-AAA385D11]
MKKLILTFDGGLKEGNVVSRPNQFTLIVDFSDSTERVYLANPGALTTVLSPGNKILCKPVKSKNRKTDFDAFAIEMGDIYAIVNSTFADSIFSNILKRGLMEEFKKYSILAREPPLPDRGRADFLLENEIGNKTYIEVKSCTHVENEVAKFPDRPTERGRRHLRSLMVLKKNGFKSYVIFVVQRPDVKKFQAYRRVDPEFADLLKKSEEEGVEIRALSTEFRPPDLFLKNKDLPVELI